MAAASLWAIDIVAPAVVLIVLLWLVIRTPPDRTTGNMERSDRSKRALYRGEEHRRRDRIDQR